MATALRSPSPSSSISSSSSSSQKISRSMIRQLEVISQHSDSDEEDEEDEAAISRVVSTTGTNSVRSSATSSDEDEDDNDQVDLGEVHSAMEALRAPPTGPANKPRKIDWEIPRKALHSSIGFFTLYLYTTSSSPRPVILVLWTALAIIVPADVLRLRSKRFEVFYERWLGGLMRESEKTSPNGVIFYILGVNFALSFYPLDVATVAILILSWADTAASTLGRLYGPSTPPLPPYVPLLSALPLPAPLRLRFAQRKSTAGFLAATLSTALVVLGFWGWVAPACRAGSGELSWTWAGGVFGEGGQAGAGDGWKAGGWMGMVLVAGVVGVVSGVAEALDLPLDDNLTLPIISGGCIFGLFKLLKFVSVALAAWS